MKDKSKDKKISYIPGRGNLSVTVFIPSDCSNNCRFCTSKQSYHERVSNLDSVLSSIRRFLKEDPLAEHVQSFVITGGEPFADLTILSKIIKAVPHRYKIYVNTTLPTNRYDEKTLARYINTHRIDGLNISRHCDTFEQDTLMFSKNIASDIFVEMVNCPVKINSVVNEDTNFAARLKRWKNYSNVYVSFRADYRKVTRESLKDLSDPVIGAILEINKVKHVSHGGCDVCFDVSFRRKNQYFSYHKGLKHSSVPMGNNGEYLIVNDIIIKQDGETSYDW